MEIKVPAPVEEIMGELNRNGCEAYIVGGCVRDMLLDREPEDWDITTSALPQQVKKLFKRTIDTGIQHGTVTVMAGKVGYEVTTYRIDGEYLDGRHPASVSFTPSLTEDLKRRDFTINAMAYNSHEGFVDEFGGIADLKAGVIRCVGNPLDRFGEDALRILRAIRFSAQLGFRIEEETFQAIGQIGPNLKKVSKERIQVELTKLLKGNWPNQIRLVYETGISPYISEAFAQVEVQGLPHISTDVAPIKHLRWAAFLRRQTPEQAGQILKDLKMDNDTIYRVKTLVQWLKIRLTLDKAKLRRAMSQMEERLYQDLLQLKAALPEEESPEPREELAQIVVLSLQIRQAGDCLSLRELAVSGKDVLAAGITGKAVGEKLDQLFELVLEDPSRNNREYLLQYLK